MSESITKGSGEHPKQSYSVGKNFVDQAGTSLGMLEKSAAASRVIDAFASCFLELTVERFWAPFGLPFSGIACLVSAKE